MKFAVIGSGAFGCYYAGMLKKAGEQVFLLSRGESLETIKRDGLRIITDSSEFIIQPDVTSCRVEDFPKVDVVIIAVKTWQVREVSSMIGHLLTQKSIIIPLQNGVESYPTLKELYPRNAIGGLTRMICYVKSPGTVRQTGFQPYIAFGRDDAIATQTMSDTRDCFHGAGFSSEISDDIQREIWVKFLVMTTFGGVGSVTQAPIGVLRAMKETREMMDDSMDEVIGVANSMNVNIGPGEKSQSWTWFESLPPETTSSTQRDVAVGKPSEIGDLSGAVVRLGKINGMNTPLHSFIYSSILPGEERARGRLHF